jgi:hypothetical protein
MKVLFKVKNARFVDITEYKKGGIKWDLFL